MDVRWFPRNWYQSFIGDPASGSSKACTIIAMLAAEKLSHLDDDTPSPNDLVDLFLDCMREGNELHNAARFRRNRLLNVPEAQSLLGNRAPRELDNILFTLTSGDDLLNSIENLLKNWDSSAPRHRHTDAYILIVCGYKTVLLAAGDTKCTLLDSHRHGDRGAVIAQISTDKLGKLCQWYAELLLETMPNEEEYAECSLVYFP